MDRRRFAALVMALILAFSSCFCVLADVRVATGSEAVRASAANAVEAFMVPGYEVSTVGIDDVMPFSSIGTVTNTVDLSKIYVIGDYFENGSNVRHSLFLQTEIRDGRIYFKGQAPENCYFDQLVFYLTPAALPSPGYYNYSFDMTSAFGNNISYYGFYAIRNYRNAGQDITTFGLNYQQSSGDIYVRPQPVQLVNLDVLNINMLYPSMDVVNIDGSAALSFTRIAPTDTAKSTGIDSGVQDYENSVSSSLGSISSSIDSVNSNLEYISSSQNLIIQGIDNVIMHISDQLYALWDQIYNLIHVPTYAMLEQILQAIKDWDVNVNVDLDELKNVINQTSNQQITNDNKNQEQLVNGYDNAGMAADQERLDQTLNEFQGKEDELLEAPKENIAAFEFENYFDRYTVPLQDISYFMLSIYTDLGALNIPVGFSLTLTIALLFIGYYRFKGGG